MVEKVPQISHGSRICDSCWKKLAWEEQPPIPEPDILEQQIPESSSTSPESNSESHHIDTGEAVASLNICLANLGETPYSQAKRCGKGSSQQKVDKLTEALKWTGIASKTVNGDRKEMIEQLKDETIPLTKVSMQLQILYCFTKKLVCKENSRRVLCDKLHGTAIKKLSQRERDSFSTQS